MTTYQHQGCQLELLYNRYWRPLISLFCLSREIREIKGTSTLRVLQYITYRTAVTGEPSYGYV